MCKTNEILNDISRYSPNEEEGFSKSIERDFKQAKLKSYIQDVGERKNYANKLYKLLVCFLISVFLILISCGIKPLCFCLSEKIIITLLATTSANVIGIFLFVVKYLFKATDEK